MVMQQSLRPMWGRSWRCLPVVSYTWGDDGDDVAVTEAAVE